MSRDQEKYYFEATEPRSYKIREQKAITVVKSVNPLINKIYNELGGFDYEKHKVDQ